MRSLLGWSSVLLAGGLAACAAAPPPPPSQKTLGPITVHLSDLWPDAPASANLVIPALPASGSALPATTVKGPTATYLEFPGTGIGTPETFPDPSPNPGDPYYLETDLILAATSTIPATVDIRAFLSKGDPYVNLISADDFDVLEVSPQASGSIDLMQEATPGMSWNLGLALRTAGSDQTPVQAAAGQAITITPTIEYSWWGGPGPILNLWGI